MTAPRHWLMKSEPGTYSIDDLHRARRTCWEGVRNYQARNTLRDDLKLGERVLFYHSSAKTTGVVGLGEVVREAYPDHFAHDPASSLGEVVLTSVGSGVARGRAWWLALKLA